jgi:hypothetical protein
VIYLYLDRLQRWLAPRWARYVPKLAAIMEGSQGGLNVSVCESLLQ